jgi:leucyl aminopeptidase
MIVYQDEARLHEALGAAGLDGSNVGSRVARGNGKGGRVMYCMFDPAMAASAATMLGTAASGVRDRHLCVDVTEVSAEHQAIVVIAVTKAMYEFDSYAKRRGTSGLSFKGCRDAGRMGDVLDAIILAADLENEPANVLMPELFATRVSAWFTGNSRVRVRTLHSKELRSEGLGLIESVGVGASSPPCMLVMECMQGKKSGEDTILMVGKGVVYDSGGLSIKTFDQMYGMHGDKSGAAVVAAVFRHFVEAKANINLVAILPLVENAVSGTSTRPGDIVRSINGKTVEVVDTDAEGRLIIADAIAYGERYHPKYVLDFATMTGTGEVIHHDLAAVIYAQNDQLASMMLACGERVGERCWRLPPWPEYAVSTHSQVADYRNAGWHTRDDGFMGAMFIHNFVPPRCVDGWLHIDISKNTAGRPGVFTATGVALGIEFIGCIISKQVSRKAIRA